MFSSKSAPVDLHPAGEPKSRTMLMAGSKSAGIVLEPPTVVESVTPPRLLMSGSKSEVLSVFPKAPPAEGSLTPQAGLAARPTAAAATTQPATTTK